MKIRRCRFPVRRRFFCVRKRNPSYNIDDNERRISRYNEVDSLLYRLFLYDNACVTQRRGAEARGEKRENELATIHHFLPVC